MSRHLSLEQLWSVFALASTDENGEATETVFVFSFFSRLLLCFAPSQTTFPFEVSAHLESVGLVYRILVCSNSVR